MPAPPGPEMRKINTSCHAVVKGNQGLNLVYQNQTLDFFYVMYSGVFVFPVVVSCYHMWQPFAVPYEAKLVGKGDDVKQTRGIGVRLTHAQGSPSSTLLLIHN